jgi:DNA-binding SARP family transcriptional activator
MAQEVFGSLRDNFSELMEAGRAAYNHGNRRKAHDIWREAATLDPYNEQVWLALLDILENEEDRVVCLQNIIAINPMNIQARRELRAFGANSRSRPRPLDRSRLSAQRTQPKMAPMRQPSRRSLLFRAVFMGMAFGLSGVLFAIVVSILLYGR